MFACGSTTIEESVSIGLTAKSGSIGPQYRKGILVSVAQMYSDICLDCGEITRLYIKENADKNWQN
ncbi:hypothetical protein [Oceanobacillus halotolerans]|uniref:hypothetical protein n=1 Tax=Oceanobacillus halotolerans TaxID=2663380 RepID=UPI0013DB0325|nr:hypothetical protein [Oceanobacillus halotolerans]